MSQIFIPTSDVVPAHLECIVSNLNWQELVALTKITLPDGTKINVGNSTPAPADRSWPWFRTNADGTPDRVYIYASGAWLSRHQMPVGMVTMYRGTEASIDTYDGGESGSITPTTGPFWAKVSELNARFPIGPGTLPSGAVIAVGDDGGAEEHTLEISELPTDNDAFNNNNITGVIAAVSGNGSYEMATNAGNSHRTLAWQGQGEAHNNMPPYLGIFFLERTARLFHRAP